MDKFNFNRLVLDKKVIVETMDVGDFLFTLAYILGYRMEDIEEKMLGEGSAKFELGRVIPSQDSIEKVRSIVETKQTCTMTDAELMDLAKKLKAMYPKGIMIDGIPWTDGPIFIVRRLQEFFEKFGEYSAEEVEDAMLRYVTAKRGSPYIRSLKNAIYKEVKKEDGTVELQSDLYNYLENIPDDTIPYDIDWHSELRD